MMFWEVETPPAPHEEQIQAILDRFDFEDLAVKMRQMHWEWALGPDGPLDPPRPPHALELRRIAARLLLRAASMDRGEFSACGGFCASKEPNGWLRLSFEIDRLDADEAVRQQREELMIGQPHVEPG